MHLGSLVVAGVVHGLERGVAAVGRGLAGGDVECLGPKLSQLERFDGGCADYDPDAVGATLRRGRAGAAVLYRGDACRTKGWVKHDFAGQIAANHRAELWEPLRRAFGSVELYGHVSGPPACVAAMRGTESRELRPERGAAVVLVRPLGSYPLQREAEGADAAR
jgi:hypothetical protein